MKIKAVFHQWEFGHLAFSADNFNDIKKSAVINYTWGDSLSTVTNAAILEVYNVANLITYAR